MRQEIRNKPITYLIMTLLFFSCSEGKKFNNKLAENQSESANSSEIQTTSNSWRLVGTIDDFGKETGESAIVANFQGTMSNSATSNSPLLVRAQLVEGQIYMRLFEYGRLPAYVPNSKFMYIAIRRPNGTVDYAGIFLWNGYIVDSGYLPGSDSNFSRPEWRKLSNFQDGKIKDNQLLNILLKESDPITIRIDMSWIDRTNSAVYVFDMNSSGLKELKLDMK